MNSTTVSRRVSSTSRTASSGRPTFASDRRRTDTTARFDSQGRGRAPEKGGVARTQAERGGIARDVGSVLVDDADNAERHSDPLYAQPVGSYPTVHHLSHRVGQGGHVPQRVRHLPEATLGQPQPVDGGRAQAVALGTLEVSTVRREDLVSARLELVRCDEEGVVAQVRRALAKPGCRIADSPAQLLKGRCERG